MNMSRTSGVTGILAEFAATLTLDRIPNAVVDRARVAIADSVGCALSGVNEPSVKLIRDVALADYRDGAATVIGCSRSMTSPAAALANASAAHALDFDSISLTVSGFVSSPVLFALLALAEDVGGVSGRRLLEAFIAGWEVEAAIARGLGVQHYDGGWHASATLGHFGAGVGAAKLLGLDAAGVRCAIGIVASEASGLRTMTGNMLNPFHIGKAARNGVLAARFAAAGFVAHDHVLEASWGFCEAFNGEGNYDLAAMTERLAAPYDLVDPGLVVKVYPCCGLIHSGIDGVLDLMRAHNLVCDQVVQVALEVHELVTRTMNNDQPDSGYQAKFSIPYCIAVALREGQVSLAHFSDAATQDHNIRNLCKRVNYGVHPELIGYGTFLENEFTDVRLILGDGRTVSTRVQRVNNVGSRGRALSFGQLEEKYLGCACNYRNIEGAKKAFDLMSRIENLNDINEVTACLK